MVAGGLMSWTPYVGDPYAQVGEGAAPVVGSDQIVASNYHPDGRSSRTGGMSSQQRLTTALAGAVPWAQMTPDQQYFVDSIASGRWGNDAGYTANAPAALVKRHADGTQDVSSLSVHAQFHIDLGGRGARDFQAKKPH